MLSILKRYDSWLVAIWGAILFIPFLGSVHLFDWDEINFAESAREMLISGNFQKVQINFQPFMEKPPLFFWLQAFSMKCFGINEFASRLPNAIIGLLTLLLIFNIGKKYFSRRLAFFWVLFITGSFTPHLYFKTGIIDPLYNLFIFLSVYHLFLIAQFKKQIHSILLGIFLGLAIITKGPVAVVVVLLCFIAYWASIKFKLFFEFKHIFLSFLFALLVSAIWFGYETYQNGPVFLLEFMRYQIDLFLNPVAGHGQPFWYHPIVLLLGCFPASVFALKFLVMRTTKIENQTERDFFKVMQILFWVVLLLFSIVETKIVHYSSLCYLPLTFIAAFYTDKWFQGEITFSKFQMFLFLSIGLILSGLFFMLPLIDYYKEIIIPFIKDDFAVACLQVDGGWNGFEPLFGLSLFATVIYIFRQLWLNRTHKSIVILLIFISIFIPLVLKFITPKIERYTQGPAIDFYISKRNQSCYIETLGFKSYAHYFYGNVNPYKNPKAYNTNWLLTDSIDQVAYFVIHSNNIKDYIHSGMNEIGRKGGFVFYERLPFSKLSE